MSKFSVYEDPITHRRVAVINIQMEPGVSASIPISAVPNYSCGVPGIKEVIFNGDHTIILWWDGTKTTAVCGEGEKFDRYAGFMAAVCKKLFGSTTKAKALLDEKDQTLRREKMLEEKEERRKRDEQARAEAKKRRAKEREKAIEQMAEDILMEQEAQRLAQKKWPDFFGSDGE